MSAAFTANRGKRPRPSARNSFVKSVTEKVSGFLPSSISKWFSSPKSTNINGSASAADITDSSTDDEDGLITTQSPSAKRMRFTPQGQHSQFNPVDTNWIPNSLEIKETSSVTTTHSSTQSPPIRSMFRHENFRSTPVKRVNKESLADNNEQDSKIFTTHHSVSSVGQSVAKKRKILQSPTIYYKQKESPHQQQLNRMHNPEQPSFKPSLLSSPFYSGRTMYGGASSFYMNQANIKQKKVVLVNESKANDTTTMSHSTRTIMDLLENYSSPLSEAKRIPHYVKNANSNKTNSSAAFSSQRSIDTHRTELYVPNIATIIQIKKRSRLMDTTSVARQVIASHSSTIGFNPYPTMHDKQKQGEQEVETLSSLRQYRLKTKFTRKNRGDQFDEETSPVNLPKAVLQVNPDSLPNFIATTLPTISMAFATTTPSTTSMSAQTSTLSTSTMGFLTSTPITLGESRVTNRTNNANDHSSKGIFKFSEPDPVVWDIAMTGTHSFSCKFGSPEREKDNVPSLLHSTGEQEIAAIPTVKKDIILTNMLKEGKHLDCCVNNKLNIDKCLSCGGKKPEEKADKLIKCVVCNLANVQKDIGKCINCERNKMNKAESTQLKPKFTWKCNDCWVNNEETVDKCVCCDAAKPNNSIPVTNKTPLNSAETDWKCVTCSNWNEDTLEKCVTCGCEKVTNKSNLLSTIKPTDDVFTNIVKSQKSDKWECRSCLVSNEKDKSLCICCGMERETEKAAHNKIHFNFNTNVGTNFKFGIFNIEPQETVMDNLMEEESLPEIPKSVECAANNMLTEMPTISNNNFEDTEFPKEIEEESSTLKFVLTEPTSAPPLNTIQLPPQASNLNIDKEKPQDLSKIYFECEGKHKQNSFFEFYRTKSEDTGTSKPISFMGSSMSSHNINPSQDYPTLPVYPSPAITTEPQILPTQNTFRFSASKLNLSGNPFESSVSTTGVTTMPSMSFVMSSQPVPTTASDSSIGDIPIFSKSETNIPNTVTLFSKKDDVATMAKPLFQKSESVAKTAQTAVTTTPTFNFGSKTQNNVTLAPTEKPKFNFVFGHNNRTESSTIFKPLTFGTMPDSDPGSNKFTLASGNTLSAGTGLFLNSLSGNGLSTGSTLMAVKPPTTNSLLNSTEVSATTISGVGSLQTNNPLSGVFGSSGQKENMWASNNNISNNMFVANTTVSTLAKPAPFAFGTSTPFNTHSSTPAFGSNSQTTQNVFGLPSQTTGTQPAMFSSPVQNQTTSSVFGNPTPASNPAPSITNMFGTQNVGATSAFSTSNLSVPSAPTPAAFNFGAAQSANNIAFKQQTPQTAGVFGFVGSPAGTPQVQFNMGTAPNVRRVRKAVRRNPQSMNYKHNQ